MRGGRGYAVLTRRSGQQCLRPERLSLVYCFFQRVEEKKKSLFIQVTVIQSSLYPTAGSLTFGYVFLSPHSLQSGYLAS